MSGRSKYTSPQRRTLEDHYGRSPYPRREDIDEIAGETGIAAKNIKIWFQNKRCKEIKQQKFEMAKLEPSSPDIVTSPVSVPGGRRRRPRALALPDMTSKSWTPRHDDTCTTADSSATGRDVWDTSCRPVARGSPVSPGIPILGPHEVKCELFKNEFPATNTPANTSSYANNVDTYDCQDYPLDLSTRSRHTSEADVTMDTQLVPCFPLLHFCPPAPIPAPPSKPLFPVSVKSPRTVMTSPAFPEITVQPYPCLLPSGEQVLLPYPMVDRKHFEAYMANVPVM